MNKIILNSAPRTGLAWFNFFLAEASGNTKDLYNPSLLKDEFIIRSHSPVMLLANFKDIKQCFVLRNPIDLISSIITKTMGGYGTNVNGGLNMPHENNSSNLSLLIDAQFEQYAAYSKCLLQNIENILPFTFEQITTNISLVSQKVVDVAINNSQIETLKKKAMTKIIMHDKGHPGYNNFLPVDKKPDIYYKINSLVSNRSDLGEMIDIYNKTHKVINEFQADW